MYNNICMYNIYVHTFITNFKFISKLEQGGKKKFEKKKQNFISDANTISVLC